MFSIIFSNSRLIYLHSILTYLFIICTNGECINIIVQLLVIMVLLSLRGILQSVVSNIKSTSTEIVRIVNLIKLSEDEQRGGMAFLSRSEAYWFVPVWFDYVAVYVCN